MRIQSIWTAIQKRYPARDRFFTLSRQVSFGKVNRIAELHYVTKEIRPMTEAFQNSRHLPATGLGAPLVIDLRDFARRFGVCDDLNLRRFRHSQGNRSQRLYHPQFQPHISRKVESYNTIL